MLQKVQKVQLKTEPQFDSEGETEDCPDHDYKPNRKNKRAFKEVRLTLPIFQLRAFRCQFVRLADVHNSFPSPADIMLFA